jgi:hypothetical protein
MTPDELRTLGLKPEKQRPHNELGDVGCQLPGTPFTLAFYKAERNDLAYWEGQRGNFAKLDPNRVGARKGLSGIVNGAQGQGICRQMVEAGGGTVTVTVNYNGDKIAGNDPCAKALEIAKQIEPKLPK